MKKNDNRRDFLKKVWAVPALIAIGTLTNPVSAEAAKPDNPGRPENPGKPTEHPGQGKAPESKLPTDW